MACKTYKKQEFTIPLEMNYDEFRQIQKTIVTYAPITFACKECGETETMTKNRLLLRDDLICTKCARKRNIIKKYGSIENFLKIRQDNQKKHFQTKYGEDVTNPSQIPGMQDKKRELHMERYGVEFPSQRDEVKQKSKQTIEKHVSKDNEYWNKRKNKTIQTCIERYGVEHSSQSEEIKQKMKHTFIDKYGVENPFQSEEVKKKIVETNRRNLGVDYPSQSQKVKNKIMERNKEQWGCDWAVSSQKIRERIVQTNNERYGGNAPACSQEVRDKMKKTCFERYGVEYSLQCEAIKKRIMESNQEKYGVDWYIETQDFRQKTIDTNMARYNSSNPGNLPEFREKAKQTSIEHWGVDNPSKSDIIRQRVNETNLKLYGNENGPGVKKILYDNIWFDSNWEVIFYRWLKKNRMDFTYHPYGIKYTVDQIQHLYFPDFLVNGRLYEVKGNYFFNENGQLIDPYNNGELKLEKQQCMIDNNVILLLNKEISLMKLDLDNDENKFKLPT